MKSNFHLIICLYLISIHKRSCDAFHNFTNGDEYRFLVEIEQSLTGSYPNQDYYKNLSGYLHITERPIGWLNCLMTDIKGAGFPYQDEFYETFVVKVEKDKVDAIMGKGFSTESGLKMKREMIQELIKDRSDLKRFLQDDAYVHDPNLRVELPFGSCKPEMNKMLVNLQKLLVLKSNASDCDLLGKALANIEDVGVKKLSDESYTSVQLTVSKLTHFQGELEIFLMIVSTPNASGKQIVMKKRMNFEYLTSKTMNRYVDSHGEAVQL